MKILSMAWSIYDERMPEFCHNYTGGGLMIRNICEYIGRKQESYLFIGRCKLPESRLGNIHIVDTNFCADADMEDEGFDKNERHLRQMTRAFEAAVEHIEPDIVNFHGIGELMQLCIAVCRKKNIPYVYTDHLFIGSETDIQGYNSNIEYQKKVYHIPDIKVIAVSTGMKRKILHDFPNIPPKDICVIRNGTDFLAIRECGDLPEKYNLEHKKVLLCVGTLNYRKNQCQIVRAFQLLPSCIQENLKVIFCGKDNMNSKLQENIINAGLQESLVYAGTVSNKEMKHYYSVADGLIMTSYAEGLSIAALEAITYGLPVIMFSDSECAEDLNDDKVACFARQRKDEGLADAITKWYETEWDRDYIKEYSKQFTMERVADEYVDYYQHILSRREDMLLSVIVPVYNVESYLEQCISSVLNQTLQNIELILVDDGSTDESGVICDKYAQLDRRVYVIHQENRGLVEARKKGIELSAGKYITFVDSDDFIDSDSYIRAVELMQKNIDVICFEKISYTEESQKYCSIKFRGGYYDKKDLIETIYPEMIWDASRDVFGLDPSLCTKIIKKELLIKSYALLNETNFYYGEDSAIIYPLLKMTSSLEVVHYAFYYHRKRKKTQCASYFADETFFDKLYILYKHLRACFQEDMVLIKQVEQFYMYSVNLRRYVYKEFVQKVNYLFPFDKVKRNERIILYGAGTVGQTYKYQLSKIHYCEVVLWVDKNHMGYKQEDIVSVDYIKIAAYDKIVVAIDNAEISQAVRRNLLKMGVEDEQIILVKQ